MRKNQELKGFGGWLIVLQIRMWSAALTGFAILILPCLILFYMKSRHFRLVMTIFFVIDFLIFLGIASLDIAVMVLITNTIWVVYLWRSERVKNTFFLTRRKKK